MAATSEERAIILNNQALIQAIMNGTVNVTALTGQQRKTVENSLYPILNGYRNRKGASNYDYAAWETGDEVQHIDASGKTLTMGQVISVPFNPTTDLDNRSKFDWYIDAKPKL